MITSRQVNTTGSTVRRAGTLARAVRVAGVSAALLGLATAFACSSSSKSSTSTTSTPCNENPWQCAAGQVCWPTSNSAFACLTSGAGQAGDTCALRVGMATCSDGLNCLATSTTGTNGICSPYCELTGDAHQCSSTSVCEIGSLPVDAGSLDSFNVCVPLAAGDDSGSDDSGEPQNDGSAVVGDASAHDGASEAATGTSDASADAPVGE